MNAMNGLECSTVKCGHTLTVGEGKLRVAPSLGIPIGEAGQYYVSRDPMGATLDEVKTFKELGLVVDGVMLFVAQRM